MGPKERRIVHEGIDATRERVGYDAEPPVCSLLQAFRTESAREGQRAQAVLHALHPARVSTCGMARCAIPGKATKGRKVEVNDDCPTILMYCGRNIEVLTREELLEAIRELVHERDGLIDQMRRNLDISRAIARMAAREPLPYLDLDPMGGI